jgi:hypothetical protein
LLYDCDVGGQATVSVIGLERGEVPIELRSCTDSTCQSGQITVNALAPDLPVVSVSIILAPGKKSPLLPKGN